MNFRYLFFWLILNYVINFVVGAFIPTNSIEGIIAYYLICAIILAFVAALVHTPAGYRKDFYKHPGFHKMMISYFGIFTFINGVFFLINFLW